MPRVGAFVPRRTNRLAQVSVFPLPGQAMSTARGGAFMNAICSSVGSNVGRFVTLRDVSLLGARRRCDVPERVCEISGYGKGALGLCI